MNDCQRLLFTLSLCLLLLSFNLFVADSEPMMSSNMEGGCGKPSKSFDEGWSVLRTFLDRTIDKVESVDNSSFTNEHFMSYYSTVYELCTDRSGNENAKLLYIQCKKAVEEYINSTVLPSLRGKKDELLLRELVIRWSNHKTMTKWISRIFHYIDRYNLPRLGLPSIEETSFLSFYDLVYNEMNKQVVDAILFMIDQERAGKQIDRTLVNNTLAIYSEIGDGSKKNHAQGFAERMIKHNAEFYYDATSNWIASSSCKDDTPKEEKSYENPVVSSKKINLESSDGVVFEVDYNVALMSRTIDDLIKANPTGDVDDNIPLPLVSSKILPKVIEYCKKHTDEASYSNHKEQTSSDVDDHLKDWDAEFIEVDHQTLFDLVLASNYLNINSLLDLASNKIAVMIEGKTPSEIRKIFNIKEDFTPEEK